MGITSRLPTPLSTRIATATLNIYNRQGREVDIALGGIPFRLATMQDLPHTIETLPIRKDQVDTEADPGEQSLAGWWRRAQASWHDGAGFLYQENSESNAPSFNFFESRGVDVFEQGKIRLLKRMAENSHGFGTVSRARAFGDGETYGLSVVADGDLATAPTFDGTITALHQPALETVVDGLISGTYFYDIVEEGKLYEGQVSSPGTATSWNLGASGIASDAQITWGKHRLWVISDRRIFQPDLGLTAGSTNDPIFTHPSQGWQYTSMAEGPSAMYFAGHDGSVSAIQAITFQSDGGLPTLSGAAVAATLPTGELVERIEVLAGQFVGIGTTHGFRVGEITNDGGIIYGPLIIEPEGVKHCTAIESQGRFFLVAFEVDGDVARIYRVDTGLPHDDGTFPYASAEETTVNGYVESITAVRPGSLAMTTSDGKAWYQHATEYMASGSLTTGRIRFRTTEPKLFRRIQVEVQPLEGTVQVELINESGGVSQVTNLTKQGNIFPDSFELDSSPQRYASVKFTLVASGDQTGTPEINSYQVQAIPAVKPNRVITVPLLCFDYEQSKTGQRYGGAGFAADRLAALQTIENEANIVTYQDFTMGNEGQLVTIERIRFVRLSPAVVGVGASGPGGLLIAELRTVE